MFEFFHFAADNARREFSPPPAPPDRICPTCAHVSWCRSTSPTGIHEFRCANGHLFFVAPIQESR